MAFTDNKPNAGNILGIEELDDDGLGMRLLEVVLLHLVDPSTLCLV